MNQKSLMILAAVLVVLMGAYFALPDGRTRGSVDVDDALPEDGRLTPVFKPDDLRDIKITKGGRTVHLKRTGTPQDWVLASQDDRRADFMKISTLVVNVRDAQVEEQRKASPETFELDPASRVHLELLGEGGKKFAELLIGKSQGNNKCFVQTADGPAVFVVNRNLDTYCGTQIDDESDKRVLALDFWYDLRALHFDYNDVIDLSIEHHGATPQTLRVRKAIKGKDFIKVGDPVPAAKDEKGQTVPLPVEWRLVTPEAAPAVHAACKGICATAGQLFAKGYADKIPAAEHGLDKPTAVTRLTLRDGTKHTLTFGKLTKDEAILKVDDRPEHWIIARFTYDALAKTLEQLKADPQTAAQQNETPEKTPAPAPEKPPVPKTPVKPDVPIPDQVRE